MHKHAALVKVSTADNISLFVRHYRIQWNYENNPQIYVR